MTPKQPEIWNIQGIVGFGEEALHEHPAMAPFIEEFVQTIDQYYGQQPGYISFDGVLKRSFSFADFRRTMTSKRLASFVRHSASITVELPDAFSYSRMHWDEYRADKKIFPMKVNCNMRFQLQATSFMPNQSFALYCAHDEAVMQLALQDLCAHLIPQVCTLFNGLGGGISTGIHDEGRGNYHPATPYEWRWIRQIDRYLASIGAMACYRTAHAIRWVRSLSWGMLITASHIAHLAHPIDAIADTLRERGCSMQQLDAEHWYLQLAPLGQEVSADTEAAIRAALAPILPDVALPLDAPQKHALNQYFSSILRKPAIPEAHFESSSPVMLLPLTSHQLPPLFIGEQGASDYSETESFAVIFQQDLSAEQRDLLIRYFDRYYRELPGEDRYHFFGETRWDALESDDEFLQLLRTQLGKDAVSLRQATVYGFTVEFGRHSEEKLRSLASFFQAVVVALDLDLLCCFFGTWEGQQIFERFT